MKRIALCSRTGSIPAIWLMGALLVSSCVSLPDDGGSSNSTPNDQPAAATERTGKRRTRASVETAAANETGAKVVEGAKSLVGASELVVNGKTFPMDCTGVVRAAYWYAGIDLAMDFSKYTGNGVTRIYKTLEAGNLLHTDELPRPGDIVFWDNTYDRNEDGKWLSGHLFRCYGKGYMLR